jgi:hypothetical protein
VNGTEPHYAPAPVRDAFLLALERDDHALAMRLARTLTTCHNPFPGLACDQLALPHGSTYGGAARELLQRAETTPAA